MAVFTPVTNTACRALLDGYALGGLVRLEGIAQGVENSNFHLYTDTGHYILTLFERRTRAEDLPFFLDVMQGLAASGIPCPHPIAAQDGSILQQVAERPAIILSFLRGTDLSPGTASPAHLSTLGTLLGRMHKAGRQLRCFRYNNLALEAWAGLTGSLLPHAEQIAPGLAHTLETLLPQLRAHWPQYLTQGPVHADLFPDNVLFEGTDITGVIDWYFACTDALLYDLAIVLDAWCFDQEHRFQPSHGQALLTAYRTEIHLPETEWRSFPLLCRGAALRFLLTRGHDWLRGAENALVTPKDPKEYITKLAFHRQIEDWHIYG